MSMTIILKALGSWPEFPLYTMYLAYLLSHINSSGPSGPMSRRWDASVNFFHFRNTLLLLLLSGS